MPALYEMWLSAPNGRRLKMIEKYSRVDCTRVANDIGAISLTLPDIYDDYIAKDNIVEIWRKPEGGTMSLVNAYFIRGWQFTDVGGTDQTYIIGLDGSYLLDGRIVAYNAGTTSTSMTGTADDLMKTVVSENCASTATDTDRDWSAYFTLAPAETAGQTITMGFSYRNVLRTLQDMAEASREAGTRLYFDVLPQPTANGLLSWHFATYANQIGVDRTGTDQMRFGLEWGNLENPRLSYDYSDERTVIYSGGAGQESERIVEEVEDTTRSGETIWARREAFYNCAGQASDTDSVYASGQAELSTMRERVRMTGMLKDGKATRFGINWQFGDKVVVSYRNREFDAVIISVRIILDSKGNENVSGKFEVV